MAEKLNTVQLYNRPALTRGVEVSCQRSGIGKRWRGRFMYATQHDDGSLQVTIYCNPGGTKTFDEADIKSVHTKAKLKKVELPKPTNRRKGRR